VCACGGGGLVVNVVLLCRGDFEALSREGTTATKVVLLCRGGFEALPHEGTTATIRAARRRLAFGGEQDEKCGQGRGGAGRPKKGRAGSRSSRPKGDLNTRDVGRENISQLHRVGAACCRQKSPKPEKKLSARQIRTPQLSRSQVRSDSRGMDARLSSRDWKQARRTGQERTRPDGSAGSPPRALSKKPSH